jgi:hypothetical protein
MPLYLRESDVEELLPPADAVDVPVALAIVALGILEVT